MRTHENKVENKTNKNVIISNMNKELWNQFKGTCYSKGMTINQAITELIQVFVSPSENRS